MNGAHSETNHSSPGSNNDNLDVVIGRFQSWTQSQAPLPRTKAAGRAATSPAAAKSPGESREVSYEQALRASKYRRPADLASLPSSPLPSFVKAPTPLSTVVGRKVDPFLNQRGPAAPTPSEPPTQPSLPQEVQPALDYFNRPSPRPSTSIEPLNAAPAADFTIERAAGVQSPPSEAAAPNQPAKLQAKPASVKAALAPKVKPERKTPAQAVKAAKARAASPLKAAAAKAAAPSVELIQAETPTSEIPLPGSPSESAVIDPATQEQPTFRDVLEGTAALVAATQPIVSTQERGKSMTLTLRVSDEEQEKIHASAAEASLSVSAYLRQCALGVSDLRQQVEMALAKLRDRQVRPEPEPGLNAIPGILRRWGNQCFRRLRGGASDQNAVALR